MKKIVSLAVVLTVSCVTFAQNADKYIREKDVRRIIKTLSADDMMGRPAMQP
jgi:hypothetical protein